MAGAEVSVVSVWRPAALSPWPNAPLVASPVSVVSVADEPVVGTVVVAPEGAVVVAPSAGTVVEGLCAAGAFTSGSSTAQTGRKRSSAVWPTRSRARVWLSTPGSCTRMVSP